MKILLILILCLWIAQLSIGQTIVKDSLICFTKQQNDSNIKITEKIIEQSLLKDTLINYYEKINISNDTIISILSKANYNISNSNFNLSGNILEVNRDKDYCERDKRKYFRNMIISLGVNLGIISYLISKI